MPPSYAGAPPPHDTHMGGPHAENGRQGNSSPQVGLARDSPQGSQARMEHAERAPGVSDGGHADSSARTERASRRCMPTPPGDAGDAHRVVPLMVKVMTPMRIAVTIGKHKWGHATHLLLKFVKRPSRANSSSPSSRFSQETPTHSSSWKYTPPQSMPQEAARRKCATSSHFRSQGLQRLGSSI